MTLTQQSPMKRCRRGEEEEEDENNTSTKKSKFIEQCSSSTRSWSDLDVDMLGEIKKKLYGADNIRFSSVCKSWKAAQHGTRPGDVLPWLMVIHREDVSKINYHLFEASAPHLSPVISDTIHLDRFFDVSRLSISYSFVYRDGCLLISVPNVEPTRSFLLFNLRTKKVVTIPTLRYPQSYRAKKLVTIPTPRYPQSYRASYPQSQSYRAIYRSRNCKMFTAVSANPTSPDCIFLAFHYINDYMRDISTFKHGDADWTTTESDGGFFCIPCTEDVVFCAGFFLFLLPGGRLGYFSTIFRLIGFIDVQTPIDLRYFPKFFGLDGELMVECYDAKARKFCIRRLDWSIWSYDWSHVFWLPLDSLQNRSLFLSSRSVYVDAINYYGVSANKIYVRRDRFCYVYSLKNGGRMLKCTLSGLRNWDGLDYDMEHSIWVEPHVFLPN